MHHEINCIVPGLSFPVRPPYRSVELHANFSPDSTDGIISIVFFVKANLLPIPAAGQ